MIDFCFKSFFEALPHACIVAKLGNKEPVFAAANNAFYTISKAEVPEPYTDLMNIWRQYQPQISEADLLVIRASIEYVVLQKQPHSLKTLSAPYLEIESVPFYGPAGTIQFVAQLIRPCGIPDQLSGLGQAFIDKEVAAYATYVDDHHLVATIDQNGLILSVNDRFCTISGHTRETLIGSSYHDICFADYDITYFRHIWNSVNSGNTWNGELCGRNATGLRYWVKTSIIPLTDEEGLPRGYLSIQYDITKAKQTEERVLLAARKNKLMFEQSPVPMWIYDMETLCIEDVNEAAIRHYGYTRTEFMNMDLRQIRPEEDVPLLESAIDGIRTQRESRRQNLYRHLKKNKELIQVRVESRRIRIADKIKRIVWIYDVTEEESARRLLTRTNMHLEAAKDITNLGYWTYDIQTKAIEWFYNIYQIFEENPNTYVPDFEKIESLFHPEDRHFLHENHCLALRKGGTHSFEARIVTSRGAVKWLQHKLKAVYNDKGDIIALEGICLDITERKVQENQIVRKNRLLRDLNSFMSLLLSRNENWLNVLQRAFGILADTLHIEFICMFEYDRTGERINYNYIHHKLDWQADTQALHLEDSSFQNMRAVLDKSFLSHLFSGKEMMNTAHLQEGQLKDYMQIKGVKSFYVDKIAVNANSYGFICFKVADSALWGEDEFLFLKSVVVYFSSVWRIRVDEDEIRKKHEQFHSVINNVPGIIYRARHDSHRTMVFMGDMTEKLTGYKPADFIENKVRAYGSIIHPEDTEVTKLIGKALDKQQPFDIEYRVMHASGNILWVHERGRGIYNQRQQLLWVDGVIMDITERKAHEEQLHESNQRFRVIMKASQEAIIDWDIKEDKTIWGDGFHDIFGYHPSQYHNHLWSDNIHPEDKERVLNTLNETLADPGRTDFSASFQFFRADGTIAYVHHKGIFIRDADGTAIKAIGSMTDMTELYSYTRTIENQNKILKDIT